jgi:DNA replication protein DnaC
LDIEANLREDEFHAQWRDGRELVYSPCSVCASEAEAGRLRGQGAPANLLHCTFENWQAEDEQSKAHLATVRDFAAKGRGFLVLLGNVGTGKSHLAVAVMRQSRRALFVTQAGLLRRLRETYRNSEADDPVEQCQRTPLLVIDDVGLSVGGRDEFPMLHEILDHRYGEYLPTILTGNFSWDAVRDILGERLCDRLCESAHAILHFGGHSHRRERHKDYFGQ